MHIDRLERGRAREQVELERSPGRIESSAADSGMFSDAVRKNKKEVDSVVERINTPRLPVH